MKYFWTTLSMLTGVAHEMSGLAEISLYLQITGEPLIWDFSIFHHRLVLDFSIVFMFFYDVLYQHYWR